MLDTLNTIGQKIAQFFKEPSVSRYKVSKNAHDIFNADSLSDLLPWEGYDEEHQIFISKNSIGFTVEAVPLVGASPSVQKEIASIYQEILEEGESLQCLLLADHRIMPFLEKWRSARENSHEIYEEIAKRRIDFYQHTSLNQLRNFRFILSYSTEKEPTPQNLKLLKEKRDKLLKTLQSLTFAYTWKVEHFLETVGGLLNFDLSKEVQKRHWNRYESLANQLPIGGKLDIEEKQLSWGTESAFTSFRVADYPDHWSLAEMQALIGDLYRDAFRINTPFYIHYGVHCPKQSREEGSVSKRAHLVEKQGQSGLLCRMIPELGKELDELSQVRQARTQSARYVWAQLSAGIWAKKEQLSQSTQTLKSLFRIHQFTLQANHYVHFPAYLSSLPMTWAEYAPDLRQLHILKRTISPECSALVPIQGEWMGTPSPGMLLSGRRGQLVNWNPFDNKSGNYNTIVVGRSGSGKSVFMQDLLLSGLSTGAKVFILEVGRSFEKLCNILDGQYIEFSHGSNLCLNPFSHIPQHDTQERDTAFSFLKSIIASMAAPQKGTTDYENALIEKAIRFAWDDKGSKATITDISNWLQNVDDERAVTLGVMLTPYTKMGVYAKYFEGECTVNLSNPMVLIELEELKEKKDLQSVVLQLFIMNITNQVFLGDRKTPFYICIDEAWDLLRGQQTGVFIETLARRLRKYFGSLVIGTQSVDDFYTTPGALAAFENSDWMCFLAQKNSSISRFAESGKIDLDEAKKYALQSVTTRHGEYSEVMICDADSNYSIVRLQLDPFSQLLYTTKAQEFAKIKALQDKGLTVGEAISSLVGEKHQ